MFDPQKAIHRYTALPQVSAVLYRTSRTDEYADRGHDIDDVGEVAAAGAALLAMMPAGARTDPPMRGCWRSGQTLEGQNRKCRERGLMQAQGPGEALASVEEISADRRIQIHRIERASRACGVSSRASISHFRF